MTKKQKHLRRVLAKLDPMLTLSSAVSAPPLQSVIYRCPSVGCGHEETFDPGFLEHLLKASAFAIECSRCHGAEEYDRAELIALVRGVPARGRRTDASSMVINRKPTTTKTGPGTYYNSSAGVPWPDWEMQQLKRRYGGHSDQWYYEVMTLRYQKRRY